jgi:hypothetical protein
MTEANLEEESCLGVSGQKTVSGMPFFTQKRGRCLGDRRIHMRLDTVKVYIWLGCNHA